MDEIDPVIASGPFQDSWESLKGYTVPQWYQDAKFGIFIHWGVYSVPAFGNEWYPRNMYLQDHAEFRHHVETFGPQSRFGYKDFIPQFTAARFDPDAWAELFKQAGARYVVPVAEHHDGFAMYDTSLSRWCAAKTGPQRDIIGELAAAVRRQGLTFGLSSHRAEHWWFMNGGMQFDSDVQDPRYRDFYGPAMPRAEDPHDLDSQPRPDANFLNDWLARCCELVDKYQPQLVYFDWWIEQHAFEPYRRKFAAYYYNRAAQWRKGVVINYKHQAFEEGTAVLDIERGQFEDIRPFFWQTDTSVSKNSWGYITHHDYKTPATILHDLIDIVSKNGTLLLNIGPKPDGTIPEPEEQILREIGRWLALNGEAIYGTRPWQVYGEGPTQVIGGGFTDTKRQPFTAQDMRFTTKPDTLYVICLGWAGDGATVTVRSLAEGQGPRQIKNISLLGYSGKLDWRRSPAGLEIRLPDQRPCDHAFVFKLQ